MVKWTTEQEEAIYARDSDILVAAAAGSGKTAVLVERVIQRLLDDHHPINIDEILVVTFTNAAAAEMRSRIGHALENALATNPESNHLKKQLSLLQRASISTLHSFYTKVVRQYAYLFDLDPAFTIADEMEVDLIKQDVIDELFEDYYGRDGEELEKFFSVVDRYSSDRSDSQVEDLILDIYTFAMQNPWPEKWLDDLLEVYNIPEDYVENDLSWLSILKSEIRDLLESFKLDLNRAMDITRESDGPYHYADALEHDFVIINEALANIASWDDLQSVFLNSKRKALSRKRVECDEDKKDQLKALRGRYSERWDKVKKSWFSRHLSAHIEDMQELYPVVKMIIELVKQFKDRFTKAKWERALVDFIDLEHLCLAVFRDESSTPEQLVASSVALNYKKQFKEVLVDEYQDINHVQETILALVSDESGRGNRFMVGDVKQSIYRFRHAEPELFIQKYEHFEQEESNGKRIDLARNFRSRESVLIGANYIFRQILDVELGEISYDEKAELIYANNMYDSFPLDDDCAELILIDCDGELEEEVSENDNEAEQFEDLGKAQLEARAYAEKIKEWIGHKDKPPLQVIDKETGTLRDIQFRDIVILHRSLTWASTIVDELKNENIPVYAELKAGYFAAIEIQVMISFLKIIDNPHQDIPLAAVLRSPIVDLDEEQLAQIRLMKRRKTLFDAVKEYERVHSDMLAQSLSMFIKSLNNFRQLAKEGALSELIWQIYRETGYYDFVGGMPGGRQRQANLRALYDRARGYEATSFRGLFRFLRFIERMEEEKKDLGSARALSEEEDVVRLMTIHKSKGLEFPVVIVGGMNREFHTGDLNKKFLLDKDYGFATKYVDPIKQINYPTLYYHGLREELLSKQLSEEMRVLYVAMTRAKEKLVMIGTVDSVEKTCKSWSELLDHPNWILPKQRRKDARCFLDWVGPALIRHSENASLRDNCSVPSNVLNEITDDPSSWAITTIHGSELVKQREEAELEKGELYSVVTEWKPVDMVDEQLDRFVDERLSYEYEYEEAALTRAKQSVTEIKRQQELKDEYSSDQLINPYTSPIIKRPNFMQTKKELSASEIGTAMHTVMQHLPLSKPLSRDEIQTYIFQFVERDILREEEANSINVPSIEAFFKTELATFIMNSDEVEKEVPFTFTLPASQVYAKWESDTDERVLIQGVIDLLVRNEEGWTIIDYKTDKILEPTVTEKVKQTLIQRYNTQINLYKQAIESIIKEPVNNAYLHFLDKQLTIKL